MSGIQHPEPTPTDAEFPAVGQYDYVPGPGDAGYVEPEAEPEADPETDAEIEDFEDDEPEDEG